MVFTTQQISDEKDLYYYEIKYYSDGVDISYWESTSDGEMIKKSDMFIDPTNAHELFISVAKHIEENDPFD